MYTYYDKTFLQALTYIYRTFRLVSLCKLSHCTCYATMYVNARKNNQHVHMYISIIINIAMCLYNDTCTYTCDYVERDTRIHKSEQCLDKFPD